MKMNAQFFGVLLLGFLSAAATSCQKEQPLENDLTDYNLVQTNDVDRWIDSFYTEPYNIEVIYKYRREMHDMDRNISPMDIDQVIPQLEILLNGFLQLYESVSDPSFIRIYTPKQIALYGSSSFGADGGIPLAGTADAGRRITLYNLNPIRGASSLSPRAINQNLHVIHHEFVHILHQNRTIPPIFEELGRGKYLVEWDDYMQNPESLSRSLGFVSRYARANLFEDFTETLSHLITHGQPWYRMYAADSGPEAQEIFLKKEAIVRDYLLQNFGINLSELQWGFQKMMTDDYDSKDFSVTYWWDRKYIEALHFDSPEYNPDSPNASSKFGTQVLAEMAERFEQIGAEFQTAKLSQMTIRKYQLEVLYGDQIAQVDLDVTNLQSGATRFRVSTTQGEGDAYDRAKEEAIAEALQPLLNYLTAGNFRLDWHFPTGDFLAEDFLKYVSLTPINDADFLAVGEIQTEK